jgi:4-hydroxy-tetrahydrodipicolinate synthase
MSQPAMIKGSLVAIVSPMHEDGALDLEALRRLVEWHIAEGTNALVVVGTTGESPTVDPREHIELVACVVKAARGRVPVVAGTGANSTREAIELTARAREVGADATLQVVPYYNKPTQEGLYQHFKAIAEAVDLPVILYSVQGRTGVNIEPATVQRLAQIPNIVGIKEASGNIAQMATILNCVPEEFLVLSGDDAVTLALIALGGRGVISVVSNEIPAEMKRLTQLALSGDFEGARKIHRRYHALMEINFVESNPIPVKTAMAEMGLLEPCWRLPLVPPKAENRARIRAVLESLKLVERAHAAISN